MPRKGRNIQLGPLETLRDVEDGLRITAKVMVLEGNLSGASANMKTLAWIKLREKELEARGLNMDDERSRVIVTLNDYVTPFEQEKARADQLAEEVEALKGQLAAEGKGRPRPPRPTMN